MKYKANALSFLLALIAPLGPVLALDCEVVNSHWPFGPAFTAEVWSSDTENLLLSGTAAVLKIYDASVPSALNELGEIAVSDPIWHIDIEDGGDLVALSDREKWVRLIDISNRAAPTELGRYEIEDGRKPYGVAFAGDYLVVTVAPAGLWVIDISDPAAPSLAGQYIEPGTDFVFDVEVIGTHAFIADDVQGVTVIDFSDPANPTRVGGFAAAGSASHISIYGTRAYVSRRGFGVLILDLSSPTMPTQIGSHPGFSYRTEVSGDYAYLAGISDAEVIDISTPSMPSSVTTFGDDTFSVAVDGDTLFTIPPGSFDPGITAYDVSTPATPVEVDAIDYFTDSQNVEIAGDVGLIANGSRGLVTVDLNQTGTLSTWGHYETDNVRSVAAVGTHAIVANFGNQLPVIDFSDPATPTLASTAVISGTSYDVKSLGDLVFVAANFGGLRILDLSDPADAVEIGFYVPSGGGGTAVSVQDNTAFLTSNTSGWVIDVTDPTMPMELAQFSMPSTSFDSDVEGDYLYVANQDGVTIFDISNPSSPAEVSHFDSAPTFANGVDIRGGRLYIAADTFWGLLEVNVIDPANPTFIRDVGTPGKATRVAADGERVLIADGNNGTRLLTCPGEPPLFSDGFENGDISAWTSSVP